MNLNLRGRTALVCGGSQGLGAAIAIELALLGANVIVLARREVDSTSICTNLRLRSGSNT